MDEMFSASLMSKPSSLPVSAEKEKVEEAPANPDTSPSFSQVSSEQFGAQSERSSGKFKAVP